MFHLVWIFIALILIGICLVPIIFFLITLQNTFKAISPQNRRMDPTQVWLCLIPLFGLGWNFYVLDKLSDSIQAELRMAGYEFSGAPCLWAGSCLLHFVLLLYYPFPWLCGQPSRHCLVHFVLDKGCRL